jgi:two-component system phosphate regulon sensor histidine kinase PhoR
MANVSHELKTPLSSIKAYCETLINGAIDDREHRMTFLERIAEQGDRLNDLIQDMLKLARIESEQQQFELVRLSVPAMAAKCAKNYAALAEAKQIALEVADGPLLHVVADEEGLRVIIDNLVDNAVKYTPMGGRVHVGWEQTVTGSVRLSVTDNGPGIPRADLPRIFERFYRVDKARSRELGSTGLGLSIVKHLAQSFGGTSGVESTLGRGSTFWVELPAAAEPVAAAK